MVKRNAVLTTLALAVAGFVPLAAQEPSRAELEEQLRQLQTEVRELQRRLNEQGRTETRIRTVTPRALVAPRSTGMAPLVRISTNRAMLGVTVRTERSARVDSIGAELTAVTPGGPAERAGLRSGDVITTFNGERLAGRYPASGEYESEPGMKLVHFASELEDGDTVVVEYRRDRQTAKATIVARRMQPEEWFGITMEPPEVRIEADRLRDMARDMADRNWVFSFSGSDHWLDMELVALNPDLGEYFGTQEGLLVVRPPRDAALNLKAGDVILKIGGRTPTSHSSAIRILRSYGQGEQVQFEIMRQKRSQTVTGTVPGTDRDQDWR
ncbi:MAG: hypothetical protein A2W29_01765 [Gemmatimonadetes bacterium RBG_16_66_8]|nr:MAG: hypothetical protein A2W29_01765 [Gemmatimonadetes bacterium RBG_16_66_8]